MRKLFMVVLLLSGSASMAQLINSKPASKQEIKLICQAINTALEKEQGGATVDMETCLNTEMKTDVFAEDVYLIKGELTIKDAGSISKHLCFASYQFEPKSEKLFDPASCD